MPYKSDLHETLRENNTELIITTDNNHFLKSIDEQEYIFMKHDFSNADYRPYTLVFRIKIVYVL